jgi:hypothetical protein
MPLKFKAPPSLDLLRARLSYDAETGVFTWRKKPGRSMVEGAVAGCLNHYGYTVIGVEGELYYAHRLAWLWMTGEWPADQIDHRNGVRGDNRWENLRQATNQLNQANRKRNAGAFMKGITKYKPNGKWQAQISVEGKHISLGYFRCPAAAHLAYVVAANEAFGEFARSA